MTDVTVENNLSRVIAAVSRELVTSTTRALTVSVLGWPSQNWVWGAPATGSSQWAAVWELALRCASADGVLISSDGDLHSYSFFPDN